MSMTLREHAILMESGRTEIRRLQAEIERLRAALQSFRNLVKEGGVPRYTINPGAALNSVIEEIVDPALRGHEQKVPAGKRREQ